MHAVAKLKYGTVSFTQKRGAVLVEFKLARLEPFATHGAHIHEYGDLSNGCTSLGGHYNPTGQVHGRHAGDLLFNIQADEKGRFQHSFETAAFKVRDIFGRSLVIHALADDRGEGAKLYKYMRSPDLRDLCDKNGYPGARTRAHCLKLLLENTKTTGNAGRRMDCAVIGRAGGAK